MPPAAVYNPIMRRATGTVLALALLICAAKPGAQVSTSDGSLLGPSITHENTPIISPRSMSAHDPLSNTDTLKPTVTIEHTDDLGYNLIYTFTNDTNKPRPLGRLVVGAITLGERVRYLSVLRGTRLPETTWDSYTGQAWRYPLDAYSTATAIMNDDYAVGVSLLYPIETYKHDALVRVGRAGGAFKGPKESRGWYVAFDLSNKKNPNPAHRPLKTRKPQARRNPHVHRRRPRHETPRHMDRRPNRRAGLARNTRPLPRLLPVTFRSSRVHAR